MDGRLDTLHTLLLTGKYGSQEELRQALASRGFFVNQSTIARDLKRLKAVRQKTADGYRYVIPAHPGMRRVVTRHDLPELQLASTTLSLIVDDEPVEVIVVSHRNTHEDVAKKIKMKLEN